MPQFNEIDWKQAECWGIGTDLFYRVEEERNVGAYPFIDAVRSICARCPIWKQCLTYGFEHEDYGVWGGLTSMERRGVRDPKKYPAQFRRGMFDLEKYGITVQQVRDCL